MAIAEQALFSACRSRQGHIAVYRNCLPTKVCIQRSDNHKQLDSNPFV
ncbi:hypothetical protein HMPREF9406_3632 [Clostridium sp. HGF2]|nr:hypothetical protein HMPREF9406_3632 [Clostridium sp. HGF2]EQJ55814.1 hypothetical protein QSI_2460 [Clostridioides difficile P28]